jgi:hypothetical protein
MKSHEKLTASRALVEQGWCAATAEMHSWGWDFLSEAEIYGRQLADHVVKGGVTAEEVIVGLLWLSSVKGLTGDVEKARQLACAAAESACAKIGSEEGLEAHGRDYRGRVSRLHNQSGSGLGQLEARDLGLGESLVKITQSTVE